MKVDVDLEQLEALRWEDLPVEERKGKWGGWGGDQVISMSSASSSQVNLKQWKVGHQVNQLHGPLAVE